MGMDRDYRDISWTSYSFILGGGGGGGGRKEVRKEKGGRLSPSCALRYKEHRLFCHNLCHSVRICVIWSEYWVNEPRKATESSIFLVLREKPCCHESWQFPQIMYSYFE